MIDNLPLNWPNKENSPELEAYFKQFGKKYYFTAEEINELRDSMNQMYGEFLANTDFISPIDLSSPAPTLPGIYIPTQAGPYPNYGGIVVNLTNKISRIIWTGFEFRQQVVGVDVAGKADKTEIAGLADKKNVWNQTILSEKLGLTVPFETVVKMDYLVRTTANVLANKSWRIQKSIVTKKEINVVTFSIVRRFDTDAKFTSPMLVKVGKKDKWIYERTLTVEELEPYNLLTDISPIASFDFNLDVPSTIFESGDTVMLAYECSGTDKVSFTFNTSIPSPMVEGGEPYAKGSNVVNYIKDMIYPDVLSVSVVVVPRLGLSYKRYAIKESDLSNTATKNDIKILEESSSIVTSNKTKIQNTKQNVVPKGIKVFSASSLSYRTGETWYKGVSEKIINTISVPIARQLDANKIFTGNITVRVGLNGSFILNKTIMLSEIVAKGLNTTTTLSPTFKFFFDIDIVPFILKENDVLYIGIMCENAEDLMNFVYTADQSGEWGERWYLRRNVDIKTHISVPTPLGPNDYAMVVKFGYNDYVKNQIKNYTNPNSLVSISSRNTNTFFGGINTVIDALLAVKPKARFVFISHFTEDGTLGNRSLVNLIDAQIAIAEYWQTDLLNLSSKLGWAKKNGRNTLAANVPDEIHPGTDTSLESVQAIKRYVKQFLFPLFNDWAGKKVAWYGTSIPYGHPLNDIPARYPDLAIAELGGTCINMSWPGSTIRRNKFDGTPYEISFLDLNQSRNYKTSMLDLIGTPNEPDLFVFDFGINDITIDPTDFDFDKNITY